jgi:excinuclease ABC subunit A
LVAQPSIELRGVRVHNLKSIDLDVPHGQLVVFCGVSGSGKTSLALDTLYAEGQRRYIESFSAYTRQFLDRLEKPDAERIDGIPPAIAVTRKSTTRSNRATIGSTTETADYLRLLYAKIGQIFLPGLRSAGAQGHAANGGRAFEPCRTGRGSRWRFPAACRADETLRPWQPNCARMDSSA